MAIDSTQLKDRLLTHLQASDVQVTDESHLHAGHEGAKSGGRHFRVRITSPKFNGLRTLARHRLVYDAVSDWMKHDIHALAIDEASSTDQS